MKKLTITRIAVLLGILVIPVLVYAEVGKSDITSGIKGFSDVVDQINSTIVKSLASLLLASGVLAFFYGIVQFIIGSRNGDSTAVTNGKTFMGWSLVALFVMFSVYGIIKLGQNILFNGKDVSSITIPKIK